MIKYLKTPKWMVEWNKSKLINEHFTKYKLNTKTYFLVKTRVYSGHE